MSDMITDCESLLGQSSLSGPDGRRGFLKVALGAGFAVAVLPVAAQNVVKTDSAGLVTGSMSVMVDGQAVPVYAAQPEGKTGLLVVLVISEIFGVHEHIADVARRFAKHGYLALAPDLFVRQGDPTKVSSIPDLMKGIIAKTPGAHHVAVRGAQSGRQGGRGRVWPPGGRSDSLAAEQPHRYRPDLESPRAGLVWRQGYGHQPGIDREDEGRAGQGRQQVGIRRVCRCGPRLQRRLPPQLRGGRRERRLCALPCLVQDTRRGVTTSD